MVMQMSYLATPYSKYFGGIEQAFIDVAKIAARLIAAGINIYSPIIHNHPITVYGGINPLDHTIWLPFDDVMMKLSSNLIVAHLPGWYESKGIAHEIAFFEATKKPIFDLDVKTLNMVKRK